MHPIRSLIVAVMTLTVLFAVTPAEADLGNGGQLDSLERLQGEDYTTPDPGCDPADGQHTRILQHEGTSTVYLPFSNCGVNFEDIEFSGAAVLTWFRVARNDEDPLILEVRVLVDGQLAGRGTYQGFRSGSMPLLLYAFDDVATVTAGIHDIRIEYTVTAGPLWHDLILDYVQWDVDDPCQNATPQPGVVVSNGGGWLKDRGWQHHVYVFSLAAYQESEGDPVDFEWAWDDGVVQYGSVVVRAFSGTGLQTAEIKVTDDPVWRCIRGTPKTGVFSYSFTSVADDWTVRWDQPTPGFSCVGASAQVRSSTPFDVIAGQCWVQGSVVANGNVGAVDVRGTLRLDGLPLWSGMIGMQARQSFLSPLTETEFHSLDACFGIANDVYERSFCGPEYLFFNVGR